MYPIGSIVPELTDFRVIERTGSGFGVTMVQAAMCPETEGGWWGGSAYLTLT